MYGTTILNLNVGILGHVDSGKTSLSKCISTTPSTACFDKSSQSQERGITLDLGFSCLYQPRLPSHLLTSSDDVGSRFAGGVRYTLVDCPGHMSLIKTIIGGSQIIDLMVLVIDCAHGIQAQTGECLVLGEMTCANGIIVALNKTDIVTEARLQKLEQTINKVMAQMKFQRARVVKVSAKVNNVQPLIDALDEFAFIPDRANSNRLPFLFSVDHCFAIKGRGLVMTGTALSGCARVGDQLEIPSTSSGTHHSIKSIQVFKQNAQCIQTGDRAGICVNVKASEIDAERGLISAPGELISSSIILAYLRPVRFYKHALRPGKTKVHLTIGHFTTLVEALAIFQCPSQGEQCAMDHEHLALEELDASHKDGAFVVLRLDKPALISKHVKQLLILSRLDENHIQRSDMEKRFTCRLGFYGYVSSDVVLSDLRRAHDLTKVYKLKTRRGVVIRAANADPNDNRTLIGDKLFSKAPGSHQGDVKRWALTAGSLVGLHVTLETGDVGVIEGTFGNKGKIRIQLSDKPSQALANCLAEKKTCNVAFSIVQKKFILDKASKMFQ